VAGVDYSTGHFLEYLMSQRPPKKNRSGKNASRKKNRSQQPRARAQQQATGTPVTGSTSATSTASTTAKNAGSTSGARPSDRRQARREAAIKKEQQKKQLRLIIGGIAAAVVVAVVLILVNRPSNDGSNIDYGDLAMAPPPIAAAGATPDASPEAGESTSYQGAFLGDPNAPVTFTIYADYQCHFCKQFHEDSYPQIIDDFVRDGQVRIEFREFPALGEGDITSDGNESAQAAEAAICAGEQDKYLEYHDKLYANFGGVNQGTFSNDRLKKFAEELGLDTDAFNECLDSGRYQSAVVQSRDEGRALGISATPMFIIDNGNGEPNVVQQTSSGYDLLRRQIQTAVETAP
jgi:protein-disulfide isomerase